MTAGACGAAVLSRRQALPTRAEGDSAGAATMTGPRYIWWTFVSSSKDRIEQAKADWKAAGWINGPFRLPPGDDAEVIPISPELDRARLRDRG